MNGQWIDVAAFDPAGDGTTDDSRAIQAAVDAGSPVGGLRFEPGTRYYVGEPVEVPVDSVRRIEGNNALLLVDGTYPALRLVGGKDDHGAAPRPPNQDRKRREFNTVVDNLQCSSVDNNYIGTGIELVQTFATRITGCHCTGLEDGIRLSDINRNPIIDANHVYDNGRYGLFFDDVNLHQCNVYGNHISYHEIDVLVTGGNHANYQLVGNCIENGPQGGADHTNSLVTYDADGPGELVIVGNNIQDHGTCEDALVRLSGANRATQVSGNYLSISDHDGLVIKDTTGVVVANNVIDRIEGTAITIGATEETAGITVHGNSIRKAGTAIRLTGAQFSSVSIADNAIDECTGGIAVDAAVDTISIAGNTLGRHEGSAIDLDNAALASGSVANNVVRYAPDGDFLEAALRLGQAAPASAMGNVIDGRGCLECAILEDGWETAGNVERV